MDPARRRGFNYEKDMRSHLASHAHHPIIHIIILLKDEQSSDEGASPEHDARL